MPALDVQIASRLPGVPAAARFRAWLRAAVGAGAAITLRVANAAEARRFNADYRRRDHATNVLTFAYGGDPPTADVVLCAQVVAREAREQGKTLAAHYAHLTVHGALHALGLDHENARGTAVMEAREVEILGTLGFDNPYVASADRAARTGTAGRVARAAPGGRRRRA